MAWPFWAATSDERIDEALRLAGLRPGEHLVDLGCGDGRVLLRAAVLHGARVTGIELDAELAATARALLADHEVAGEILEADFADAEAARVLATATVVFAYLSPATLQRLRPQLAALPAGARLVTTGYAVPGWAATEAGGRCYLYRLPPTTDDDGDGRPGWQSAGVLVSLHPDSPALVAVKLTHPGGPVTVTDDGGLALRTGADEAAPGDEVVVDLRFEPLPVGTVVETIVEVEGVGPFHVLAVADEEDAGMWHLGLDGCAAVAAALHDGRAADVLGSARQSQP